MAEQVNQRLEGSMNELEQMKRIGLYNDEEINEISRKRKDLEYQLQRHEKKKEDFVSYISFELTLLEDITFRRKEIKMNEKKKDIEYAIASRVNRVFKQFIHRFNDDVKVYFEYFKFCKSVGFEVAASGMVGEMLQMHGDKPVTWQFASKWEMEERDNIDGAREFLINGLQRHPTAEILYFELFKLEVIQLVFKAEEKGEKMKLLNRAEVVSRNAVKNLKWPPTFLMDCLELLLKYEVQDDILGKIKNELWGCMGQKGVLPFIAQKELEGCHFIETEEFANREYPEPLCYCIGAFTEAINLIPLEQTFTKFIHALVGMNESLCTGLQKIAVVKYAWSLGYKSDLLSDSMFEFGLNILRLEGETSKEDMWKLINEATEKQSQFKSIWAEKLLLTKFDENKQLEILQAGVKAMTAEDSILVFNELVNNIKNPESLNQLVQKLYLCESTIVLAVKPKILLKMYELNGLRAARDLYNTLLHIPPIQIEVFMTMIQIEKEQPNPNVTEIQQCFSLAIVAHGSVNVDLWDEYIDFETTFGNSSDAVLIHMRAMEVLPPELANVFQARQCAKHIGSLNENVTRIMQRRGSEIV